MGYRVYLQEARVVIPHERQPLALAALKRLVGDFPWVINERYFHAETFAETLQDLRWRPVQDRAGNVFTFEFNGQKLSDDRALFETLAPFVEPGSYVLIEGEDNSRWIWTFDGLQVHLEDPDRRAYDAPGYLARPLGVPTRRTQPFPSDPAIYTQATHLAALLLSQHSCEEAWHEIWHNRFSRRQQTTSRLALITLLSEHGAQGLEATLWWLEMLIKQLPLPHRDPGDVGLSLGLDTLAEIFRADLPGSQQLQDAASSMGSLWARCLPTALSTGSISRISHLQLLAEPLTHFPTTSVRSAVQLLLTTLHDPWYEARRNAAEMLGRLGNHTPIEQLHTLLQTGQWEQREAALHALAWQSARVPFAWLQEALNDEHDAVRAATLLALGSRQEPDTVALLEAALTDRNDMVQLAAYHALGMQGKRAPLEQLLQTMETRFRDTCPALDALGKLGEQTPIDLLIAKAHTATSDTAAAALLALERIEERLSSEQLRLALQADVPSRQLITSSSPYVRVLARRLLGKHTPAAEILHQCDTWHTPTKAIAALILGTQGPTELVEPLRRFLKGDHLYYQERGAHFALEAIGQGATPADLVLMLTQDGQSPSFWLNSDENNIASTNSQKAYWALEAWHELLPIETLTTLARNPHTRSLASVLRLLALLDERAPIDLFLEILDTGLPAMRSLVSDLLKRLWKYVPLEAMLKRMESPDLQIRHTAIFLLGKARYQPLIPQLLTMLLDSTDRNAAQTALTEMAEFVPVEELLALFQTGDRDLKTAIIPIFGRMGPRAPLQPLLDILKRRATFVRQLSAESKEDEDSEAEQLVDGYLCRNTLQALGNLGEYAPLEPLLIALRDPNSWVQSGALEAMKTRGGSIPVDDLLPLLHSSSEYIRRDTARVLGVIDNPAASEHLFTLLADHAWDVREEAVQALQNRASQLSLTEILTSLYSRSSSARAATLKLLTHPETERLPIGPIILPLGDPSIHVRREAASTLAAYSEQVPLKPLLQVLRDPSELVRMTAVTTLAKMQEPVLVLPLLAALGDTSHYVRQTTLQALFLWYPKALHTIASEAEAVMQERAAGPLLGSLERSLKARVLGDIGQATPTTVAFLTKSLTWHYWQTRLEAAKALGKLEGSIPRTTLDRLLELRNDRESSAVREAAHEALNAILAREADILEDLPPS